MHPSHLPVPERRTLTVHETHRPPAPVLRHIDEVVGGDDHGITFRYSQGVLTRFDVDVVHVHDTHLDVLLGTKGAGPVQRWMATLAFARNLRKHGIALVRTLSATPDAVRDDSASARRAAAALDSVTSAYVVGSSSTPTPDAERTTLIPHAEYRERFVGYPSAVLVPGRLLCLARGRLPVEATALAASAQVLDTPDITVRLVGAADDNTTTAIGDAVARRRGVLSARLERLSDGARIQEIDEAELVVLPRSPLTDHDLQVLFLALSRSRPVLAQRTPELALLADEVGPEWLVLSDGPVSAETIDAAFAAVRSLPRSDAPDLGARTLTTTRAAYAELFHRVATQGMLQLA